MEWSEWIQNIGSGLLDRTYELERLKLEQRGAGGSYTEGQPATPPAATGGLNPTVLLIGAAVLAVVLLRN